MRRTALLAAPLATLIVALAGCAQSSSPGTGPGPGTTTGSSGCPISLLVTVADGGKTLCVTKGGTVTFDLGPEAASATSPLDVSGTALTQGAAEGTYSATEVGTATATTQRRNCPPPSPGQLGCHSIQLWKVTIEVKA